MALLPPPPPLIEPSNKAYKINGYPDDKAKDMSFFAFIFSIFIYIFIFYIFNLSPRSLLNNTKFWFFISNTLIFIIAIDYGVFSSLKEKQDFYDEYMSYTTQARNNASSFVTQTQYPEMLQRTFPNEDSHIPMEKKKVVISTKSEPPERVLGVIKSEPKDVAKVDIEGSMQKKMKEARKFSRSKSERYNNTRVPTNSDYNQSVMRRSKTGRHEPREDDNEFSTMSDEELNRRVEEFIQRFNRQIRLQREYNFNQN